MGRLSTGVIVAVRKWSDDVVMARHRFDAGQTVIALASGIPPGPYVIIRHLPLVRTEPHYHAKDEAGIVRALLESQIREFRASTQGAVRPPQLGRRRVSN